MAEVLDLAAVLRPGDLIVVGQGAGEPVDLVRRVRAAAKVVPDLQLYAGLSLSGEIDVELARDVRISSYAAMGTLAQVAAAGLLDIVPTHYGDLPAYLTARMARASRSVVLLQLGPADADGWHSPGVSQDFAAQVADRADLVVAEINARMPSVRGGVRVHSSQVTVATHTDRPLISTPTTEASDAERGVADHVATLVADGACVQLGIGGIPAAVATGLAHRRGLRVHSALVGEWLLSLSRTGALARSSPVDIPVVAGAALGSPELYDFVAASPDVRMGSIPEVSPIPVLAAIPGLVAVNAALQVDLTGQVNAETIGARYGGGLGGQLDFLRGAQLSSGGLAVVALTSTAKQGTASRIVRSLDDGWVTTPRSCVDVVVTEFGIAELTGASFDERARRLVRIAHPDFRPYLSDGLSSIPGHRNPRRRSHVST